MLSGQPIHDGLERHQIIAIFAVRGHADAEVAPEGTHLVLEAEGVEQFRLTPRTLGCAWRLNDLGSAAHTVALRELVEDADPLIAEHLVVLCRAFTLLHKRESEAAEQTFELLVRKVRIGHTTRFDGIHVEAFRGEQLGLLYHIIIFYKVNISVPTSSHSPNWYT